eukprot:TRINITY_DN10756_c0_g2_i1.p2 TRINITY_DN10756_c0_g2~~TRINITY_DN10756_c0_g2_i1.p2  ORF type:complete len:121 (+),score=0.56 TRINITY_DN10756_c0_g2_i1:881-1243(+)
MVRIIRFGASDPHLCDQMLEGCVRYSHSVMSGCAPSKFIQNHQRSTTQQLLILVSTPLAIPLIPWGGMKESIGCFSKLNHEGRACLIHVIRSSHPMPRACHCRTVRNQTSSCVSSRTVYR